MSQYNITRNAGALLLALALSAITSHAQCGTTPAEILLTTGRRSLSADVLPSPDGSRYVVLASVEPDSLSNGMVTGRGSVLLRYGAGNRLEWAKHGWYQGSRPLGGWESADVFRYAIDSAGGVLVASSYGRLVNDDTVHRWRRFAVVHLRPDGTISGVDSLLEAHTSNYRPPVVEFAALSDGIVAATQNRCGIWRIGVDGTFSCVAETRLIDYQFHSVASDGHGGALVAGEFLLWYLEGDTLRTPASLPGDPGYPQPAYFVARWTLDGRLDWHFLRVVPNTSWRSHEYQTLAARGGVGAVLSFDDTTSLFVRGTDTIETGPLTVAVFGLDGAFRWVRSFDYKSRPGSRIDETIPDEVEFDLEIGAGGYVYASVPGRWARNGRFPLNETDTMLVTAEDQILLVFDSTGGLACARVLPNAAGAGLGADRSGRVFLTGLMGEFTVLNGDTLHNPSWPRYSLFLTELVPPSSGVAEAVAARELRAIPNPAHDRVEMILPEHIGGRCRVVITGVAGERIREETHDVRQTGRIQLDVSALPSGVYSATIETGREVFRSRVVVVR